MNRYMKPFQYASIMAMLFYIVADKNNNWMLYGVSIMWMLIVVLDLIPAKK